MKLLKILFFVALAISTQTQSFIESSTTLIAGVVIAGLGAPCCVISTMFGAYVIEECIEDRQANGAPAVPGMERDENPNNNIPAQVVMAIVAHQEAERRQRIQNRQNANQPVELEQIIHV